MQCAMIEAQVAALTVEVIEDLPMIAALVPEGGVDEDVVRDFAATDTEYQTLLDRILTDSWAED